MSCTFLMSLITVFWLTVRAEDKCINDNLSVLVNKKNKSKWTRSSSEYI